MPNTDESLDIARGMFRTSDKTTDVTIMMGRTKVGPVNTDVTVAEIGGRVFFEGDIEVGSSQELADAIAESRGIGVKPQFRWPTSVIPFVTVDALRARVAAALAHWTARTPFTFVPHTTEKDFLSFKMLDGCFSRVGRQGGEQVISLGLGCGLGSAIHEIGHSLGLWHEQSRSDRDEHITVHLENVDPAQRHNFDKHILDGTDLGGYDFGSIMHYPRDAFSVNGKDTITTKTGQPIGQRNGLSAGDIAAMKLLYPSFNWAGK